MQTILDREKKDFREYILYMTLPVYSENKILNNGLKTQVSLCSSKKCLFLIARYKRLVDQEQTNKEHLVYRHNLCWCHSYPCLVVKYGLGPRISLRCGLIPKPVLRYLYRRRHGDVRSMWWDLNKTEIDFFLFSKHFFFFKCVLGTALKNATFWGLFSFQ